MRIWTIGHSTREIDVFIELLKENGIRLLADVRMYPGSKRYPQFGREALAKSLEEAGIRYEHFPELGGRRKAKPDSKNTAWRNEMFRGYADYMEVTDFKKGIERLLGLAEKAGPTAIMCAEAVWWRCHRSLISDYLKARLPVGVVTAIAGASRMRVNVTGLAGHAGTVPMGSRQDALCASAEMVLFVERSCEAHKGLVGTVGKVSVQPGAINVIPQDVEFTIDVRSGDDALRREAVAAFQSQFEEIAKRRRVRVIAAPFYAADAAPCDADLQAQFAQAISAHGIPVRHLPSGAGHDAMVFPPICPMAMLFVRCGNNGISHHPDETMTADDAEIATSVLLHFFEHFDAAAFVANRK